MRKRPHYFDRVSSAADKAWQNSRGDGFLGGLPNLMLRQLNKPRHVVSELLQNADDAGATEAHVSVSDGNFVLRHNGNDFTEKEFVALCSFGSSSKHSWKSIGFRGIGFKTTFSIGEEVSLTTPSLSIVFQKHAFIVPRWRDADVSVDGWTEIRVPIADGLRQKQLDDNLTEWQKSPASVLFFKSLTKVFISDVLIEWTPLGPGPVANSFKFSGPSSAGKEVLLIRSSELAFPPDSIAEIVEQRSIPLDAADLNPTCQLEIVLGIGARLYAVLPTDLQTALPFACNAPFILTPDRGELESPAVSATNRWLLDNIGRIAAEAALTWLARTDLPGASRCQAYRLMPDVNRKDTTPAGICAAQAELAYDASIADRPYIVTMDGALRPRKGCILVPKGILSVWSDREISQFLDDAARPLLSNDIQSADVEKLLNWGFVQEFNAKAVLDRLNAKSPLRPKSWQQLLALWSWVREALRSNSSKGVKQLRIFPVAGSMELQRGEGLLRFESKNSLSTEEDRAFVGRFLTPIDEKWLSFLSNEKKRAQKAGDDKALSVLADAEAMLDQCDMAKMDASKVVEAISAKLFAATEVPNEDCVRIAHIAAALKAPVGKSFKYVNRQDGLISPDDALFDLRQDLTDFVTAEWYDSHVILDEYSQPGGTCTEQEWLEWCSSTKSGMHTFVQPQANEYSLSDRRKANDLLQMRGADVSFPSGSSTTPFRVSDWDFDNELWLHWDKLAESDVTLWNRLLNRVTCPNECVWSERLHATVAPQYYSYQAEERCVAHWIVKLRTTECLRNARGTLKKPGELWRRTAATEGVIELDDLVEREMDVAAYHELLDALDFQTKATDPTRTLSKLRALAKSNASQLESVLGEVMRCYRALEQILENCDDGDKETIHDAFRCERLILSDRAGWMKHDDVFLASDEDCYPGAPLVHPSVRILRLWDQIKISQRPTQEMAIQWLRSLSSNKPLASDASARVRRLIPVLKEQIWTECGHWLTLNDVWASMDQLKYATNASGDDPWNGLFDGIRQTTADLCHRKVRKLLGSAPFNGLADLATTIEERATGNVKVLSQPRSTSWLQAIGRELQRVGHDDDVDDIEKLHHMAARLAGTMMQTAAGVESQPCICGVPVGRPRTRRVAWIGTRLYVADESIAMQFAEIADAICSEFSDKKVREAIHACVDRSDAFIVEYLRSQFDLAPLPSTEPEMDSAELDDEESQPSEDSPEEGGESTDRSNSDDDDSDESSDSTDDEQDDQTGDDKSNTRRRRSGRSTEQTSLPPRPPLVERFARSLGLRHFDGNRYCLNDGGWLVRGEDRRLWEHFSRGGKLMQSYRFVEECLDAGPVEIDADVWSLCAKYPVKYTLVLVDSAGEPRPFGGRELQELYSSHALLLNPATYRLLWNPHECE